MATELEKLLGEDDKDLTPPLEDKKPQETDPEAKKQEQLDNLNKAIAEANETLRKKRVEIKNPPKLEEEKLPEIDFNDPGSKAWDKHIKDSAAPAQQAIEESKVERRTFVLRQFLQNKPALAKDPTKIKAMMETYDRIRTATELTNEGIERDLNKAYAAEFSEELIDLARTGRVEEARNKALFSDIAVTRGSTAYSEKKQTPKREYSEDELSILNKWGMTPEEHSQMVQETKQEEA